MDSNPGKQNSASTTIRDFWGSACVHAIIFSNLTGLPRTMQTDVVLHKNVWQLFILITALKKCTHTQDVKVQHADQCQRCSGVLTHGRNHIWIRLFHFTRVFAVETVASVSAMGDPGTDYLGSAVAWSAYTIASEPGSACGRFAARSSVRFTIRFPLGSLPPLAFGCNQSVSPSATESPKHSQPPEQLLPTNHILHGVSF